MRSPFSLLSAAALWATASSLATITLTNGAGFKVGVPSATTSSGGQIYIQITASDSYQWVGIGIGSRMAGSKMFIIYSDGNGNVTVSPRTSQGQSMPSFDSSASVTVLAGSGISNNVMTANFAYKLPANTIDTTSNNVAWIGGWKTGSALDSTNKQISINQHDDYSGYSLDLSGAGVGTSSNPFVAGSSSGSGSSTNSGSSSSSSSSSSSGSGSGSTSGSDDTGSIGVTVGTSSKSISTYEQAHGILISVPIVVLFPIGALTLRLGGGVWLHAFIQLFSLVAISAGFALGYKLAQMTDLLYNNTHTVFGTVIFGLFLVQPLVGLAHHMQYRKIQRRGIPGLIHIWYGRIIIALGIINGGLGLQLAANTAKGNVAYGVIAGVIVVIYFVVIIFTMFRKNTVSKYEMTEL